MDYETAIKRICAGVAAGLCGPCHVCHDEPRYRVEYDDPAPAIPLGVQENLPPQPPAACPGCGQAATIIRVRYVDDWRAISSE